jgi:LAO/AO transport system kinase
MKIPATYPGKLQEGDTQAIARIISVVENEVEGYEKLLAGLPHTKVPVIGITGPPGAGKSTLTDALIGELVRAGKKVAVLCVDPSSPFNMGALLGDRIRMSEWYTNPNVFIRSLATRGSLGGLHPKIIEITELLKAASFDYILVETVGVGQSEVEIAGLADATIVVLVPESGDDIQVMKAGLMEIADLYVVNKSDRPGADLFIKNLQARANVPRGKNSETIPVLKTVASQKEGVPELFTAILHHLGTAEVSEKKYQLLAQRVYHIIRDKRMKNIDMEKLVGEIKTAYEQNQFNLYKVVAEYL